MLLKDGFSSAYYNCAWHSLGNHTTNDPHNANESKECRKTFNNGNNNNNRKNETGKRRTK